MSKYRTGFVGQGNSGWWKRRSPMERSFMLITIAFVIAVFVILIPGVQKLNKKPDICLTDGCIHTSSRILKNLDTSVDPCEDFYSFACGTFVNNTHIPDDKSYVNEFSILEDRVLQQLQKVLSKNITESEPRPFQLAKSLYKSCLNTEQIDSTFRSTINRVIAKLGGWPVLEGDRWDRHSNKWQNIQLKLAKMGFYYSYMLSIDIMPDWNDTTRRILSVDEPWPCVSREFLLKERTDPVLSAYLTLMIEVAKALGAEKGRAEREMNDVLSLIIDMAKITNPLDERRNMTNYDNYMKLGELQWKYNFLNWSHTFNTLLPHEIRVDNDELIEIKIAPFYGNISSTLRRYSDRTIANYLVWRAVEASIPYLSKDLRLLYLEFEKKKIGKMSEQTRSEYCAEKVKETLSAAVGALYVREYFSDRIKSEAEEMISKIRDALESILSAVPWMDSRTRATALVKLKKMITIVAYPEELKDINVLEEYHRNLQVPDTSFLEDTLEIHRYFDAYEFSRLREPVNKLDWRYFVEAADVNAYARFTQNSVQIPAGILQGAFFDVNRTKYMNFGGLGMLIGHEFTHNFDDQGKKFDPDGRLVNWWQPATVKAYDERAKCIVRQYSTFRDPQTNLTVRGNQTEGEDISDLGGANQAYLAYKRWVDKNGREPGLPGLDFTPEQLFWIATAQPWCAANRDEELRNSILNGFHSPERFRVLGSLMNNKNFAKDFNCPVGSKMNPREKCEIW